MGAVALINVAVRLTDKNNNMLRTVILRLVFRLILGGWVVDGRGAALLVLQLIKTLLLPVGATQRRFLICFFLLADRNETPLCKTKPIEGDELFLPLEKGGA